MAFFDDGNFLSAERPADAFEDNPPLSVPILSLDMFVDQRADLAEGRILLKIDVEGFEPEVLAGADNLLASGRSRRSFWRRATSTRHPSARRFSKR